MKVAPPLSIGWSHINNSWESDRIGRIHVIRATTDNCDFANCICGHYFYIDSIVEMSKVEFLNHYAKCSNCTRYLK